MSKLNFTLLLLSCLLSANLFAQNVPAYVPTNGLVGWWPFNGNANDESGNGYTYTGSINSFTLDRFGQQNSAIDLSGQTNSIATNYQGILGQNARTCNLWFKVLATNGNNPDFLSYGSGFGGGWNMLLINQHPTIDNSNSEIQYDPVVSIQTWHMFTVTFESSFGTNTMSCKLYIDGTQLTNIYSNYNGNQILNTIAGNPILFGVGGPSNAIMDDVGIWNRVLSQQEISDLYNSVNCANNLSISPTQNNVQRGNTATFTATTSDPNPTVIWQSDLGQGFQTLNNVGNYSGTNTATLNIANVQLSEHNQPVRAISTSGNCVDTSAVSVINVLDTCVTTVFDTITTFISVTDTLIINAVISSVNPPNNVNTLLIYPNPANTHITIDNGNFATMAGYSVRINNALGQVVFNQNITQQQFFIDLSTWTGPGLYYVNILDPNGNPIEVKKIVIQ